MRFAWNDRKAASNFAKHGVSFHEAATTLGDPLGSTYPDLEHSTSEQRWITIGLSEVGRILVVSHAEAAESTVRIISARRATRKERDFYEQA